MKLNFRRVVILLLLIGLSVTFGATFDAVADRVERHRYPKPERYTETVSAYAARYGVPEAVIWAIVRTESNFESSARREDGSTGLMQLTPEQFADISARLLHGESADPGLLYDPDTNLRAGCALLSDLYARYGVWDAVYLAWHSGTTQTDLWMSDPACVNDLGIPVRVPDADASSFLSRVKKTERMYAKLYYDSK